MVQMSMTNHNRVNIFRFNMHRKDRFSFEENTIIQ